MVLSIVLLGVQSGRSLNDFEVLLIQLFTLLLDRDDQFDLTDLTDQTDL